MIEMMEMPGLDVLGPSVEPVGTEAIPPMKWTVQFGYCAMSDQVTKQIGSNVSKWIKEIIDYPVDGPDVCAHMGPRSVLREQTSSTTSGGPRSAGQGGQESKLVRTESEHHRAGLAHNSAEQFTTCGNDAQYSVHGGAEYAIPGEYCHGQTAPIEYTNVDGIARGLCSQDSYGHATAPGVYSQTSSTEYEPGGAHGGGEYYEYGSKYG